MAPLLVNDVSLSRCCCEWNSSGEEEEEVEKGREDRLW